jgi:hypothetical protein
MTYGLLTKTICSCNVLVLFEPFMYPQFAQEEVRVRLP